MSEPPPYPDPIPKRRRRLSLHALGILLAGFAWIATRTVTRYNQYWNGVAMENGSGLLEFALIAVMIASGAVLALTMFVAPFQALLRRKFQPLLSALLVGALGFITYLIPFPSYIDGVAATLSRQEEKFYRDLEQRLAKLPKPSVSENSPVIPDSWYDELPGLAAIFPGYKEPWGSVRIRAADTHFDLIVGGSLGGTTGLRIYRNSETPEHLDATEYVGAFREIYPRVYAYQRHY